MPNGCFEVDSVDYSRRGVTRLRADLIPLRDGALEQAEFTWAYFDTGRATNGGTEAINGLIELHRRIARGFRNRDHYRLRMLLIGGGLTSPT
jgi:Transposase